MFVPLPMPFVVVCSLPIRSFRPMVAVLVGVHEYEGSFVPVYVHRKTRITADMRIDMTDVAVMNFVSSCFLCMLTLTVSIF